MLSALSTFPQCNVLVYVVDTLYSLGFEVGLFLVSLVILFLWFSMLLVALAGFIEENSRERGEKGL